MKLLNKYISDQLIDEWPLIELDWVDSVVCLIRNYSNKHD